MPGHKLGKNVSLGFQQIVALSTVSAPKAAKKLQLNYDTRVELDYKFSADELKDHVDLKMDSRLAGVHLEIAWWLIERDLEIESCRKIAFIRPDLTATVFYQIRQAEGAEALCIASAKFAALTRDAECILVPVWGGVGVSQHWALLSLEKIAGS